MSSYAPPYEYAKHRGRLFSLCRLGLYTGTAHSARQPAKPYLSEAYAQLRPDAGATHVELPRHPRHRRLPLAGLTLEPVHLVVDKWLIHDPPPFCWCCTYNLRCCERAAQDSLYRVCASLI